MCVYILSKMKKIIKLISNIFLFRKENYCNVSKFKHCSENIFNHSPV